jgi:hypothetical protein
MQHPDEGTIHAWIDGELSPDDALALEAHLEECADCSALAAEARGLVAASSRIVSALDIVPGGVIPKVAPRRPWYMGTQLRAAAAVAIVAGASLLVAKNGGEKKMESAMRISAPAETAAATAPATVAAQPELDQATAQSAPAPVVAETPPKPAPTKTLEGKVAGAGVSERRKETANEATTVAQALPTPPSDFARAATDELGAAKPKAIPDSAIRDSAAQRRRALSTLSLNAVVVTGVATSSAPMELKKLRADSAKNETVFEVLPGVEVTLTDNGHRANIMLRDAAQSKEKQLAASAPAPAAPPPMVAPTAAASKTAINFITWTDKRGHLMMLKGALSREQLEALRQRLPEDQR